MEINADFRDLLRVFDESGVRYLVVGAQAVGLYAEPRFTKDLDVWVDPTAANARLVWEALRRFGAPLRDVSLEDFQDPRLVYQIGVEPHRIDVLMGLPRIRFSTAWRRRRVFKLGGISVNVLSSADLIRSKRLAGRPQDLLDVSLLKEAGRTRRRRRGNRG